MEKNDETLIRIVTSTFFCTIGRHCEDSGKGWTGNVHLGTCNLSRQADGYIAKQAKEARPFLERFGRSLLENFVEEALPSDILKMQVKDRIVCFRQLVKSFYQMGVGLMTLI